MSGKRSRWGGPPTGPQRRESSVSDQDAVAALLESAEARQKEREERPQKQHRPDDDERRRDDRRGDRERGDRGDRRQNNNNNNNRSSDVVPDDKNYYGPAGDAKAASGDDDANSEGEDGEPKQKPNFGLSGALAKDDDKGNVYKGVLLKFSEPPEARAPNTQWRLYVFKGEETLDTLHISKQSAYLLGRNADISDIPLLHGSCSSQHAVLQYRAVPNAETGKLQCSPYIMDLESTNGTFLNGVKIGAARYYQMKKGDVLKFAESTREYVLLTANTTSIK